MQSPAGNKACAIDMWFGAQVNESREINLSRAPSLILAGQNWGWSMQLRRPEAAIQEFPLRRRVAEGINLTLLHLVKFILQISRGQGDF